MYFLYEKGEHMLTKLVSEEHINFMESVEDWKEAIRVAAKARKQKLAVQLHPNAHLYEEKVFN